MGAAIFHKPSPQTHLGSLNRSGPALYIEMEAQLRRRGKLRYVFRVTSSPNASYTYKRVPQAWVEELNPLFGPSDTSYLGNIFYQFYYKGKRTGPSRNPTDARTCTYYPKSGISQRTIENSPGEHASRARGLPYFLEAMATIDLKKRGIGFISTSNSPSERRIKQVERTGLQRLKRTEINVWLAAMGNGIRSSILRLAE